jgi:hypothetical protein
VPWTRKQVKYLLSSASPLTGGQKAKMKGELHSDPAMGHKKKGSSTLTKGPKKRPDVESHSAY